MIDIIICDKNPLIRSGLEQLLLKTNTYNITSTATDGERLLEAIIRFKSDIAIMGWEMPCMGGEEVLYKIQQMNLTIKIVVYSARNIAFTAMQLGAAGYLSKRDNPEKLLTMLPLIAKEQLVFPYQSIREMSVLSQKLSPRETQILELLSDGSSNQAIADRLCLSINTVKFHLKNIYATIEVSNRLAAVNKFRDMLQI